MATFTPSGSSQMKDFSTEPQEQIDTACFSFTKIGYARELFTISNLHNHCFTEKRFLEVIKPLSSITNSKVLQYMFDRAKKSFLWDLSPTAPNKFSEFITIVDWLNKNSSLEDRKHEIPNAYCVVSRMLLENSASLIK